MSVTISTKVDTSKFKALKSQIERIKIDVGYISTPVHWLSAKMGHDFTVAELASHLHYYSPWRDKFMLTESKKAEVNTTVQAILRTSFGKVPVYATAQLIGLGLQENIRFNIEHTDSPENSTEWAAIKGFNDPLVFGSDGRVGQTPNLISELTHRVRG